MQEEDKFSAMETRIMLEDLIIRFESLLSEARSKGWQV